MKVAIFLFATMAISGAAHSQPDDQLLREYQLKVSEAYSQCAAYYEISAAVRDETNGVGTDDAKTMKKESMTMAFALATEYGGKDKARKIADDSFAKAIEDMHSHITSDPESFGKWADKQRRSCRMAVNDPPTFVEKKLVELSGKQRTSAHLTLPRKLTVEDILKHGKPATGTRKVSKCKDGKEINIPLDDVLLDGGMVCAERHGDVCGSERSWMSYSQYIQSLYPGREFGGHVHTLSISFKNGQRQDKRTLVACLILPETRT